MGAAKDNPRAFVELAQDWISDKYAELQSVQVAVSGRAAV